MQHYREMQHLIQQTLSLTLFGRLVTSLCKENPSGVSSVKSITLLFFPSISFSFTISSFPHTTDSSHLHCLFTSTSLFLCIWYRNRIPSLNRLAEWPSGHPPGHLSNEMFAGKHYQCQAGNVQQAALMFIWFTSKRSSRADPPYQATTRCLAEDIWSIILGPALLRSVELLGHRWSTSEKKMVWISALHSYAFLPPTFSVTWDFRQATSYFVLSETLAHFHSFILLFYTYLLPRS